MLKEPRQIHNLGKYVEDTKTDIDKGAEEVNKMEKKSEEREHKIDEFIVSDSVLDIVKNNGMMVVRKEATNSYWTCLIGFLKTKQVADEEQGDPVAKRKSATLLPATAANASRSAELLPLSEKIIEEEQVCATFDWDI